LGHSRRETFRNITAENRKLLVCSANARALSFELREQAAFLLLHHRLQGVEYKALTQNPGAYPIRPFGHHPLGRVDRYALQRVTL
jgi:hypothetical protein